LYRWLVNWMIGLEPGRSSISTFDDVPEHRFRIVSVEDDRDGFRLDGPLAGHTLMSRVVAPNQARSALTPPHIQTERSTHVHCIAACHLKRSTWIFRRNYPEAVALLLGSRVEAVALKQAIW
jgi:hypothetical protein